MNKPKPLNFYWRNIIFLALGLFLLNAWVAHIFGDQFINFVWTNGFLAIAAIVTFFLKFFTESETAQFRTKTRERLDVFTSNRSIALFYGIFLLVSSSLTSIVIETKTGEDPIGVNASTVSLGGHNNKIIDQEDKKARFIRFTHPFGRKFVISAEGFSEKQYRVFPWFGKRIILEETLKPAPALWVRLPSTLVNTILDQCRLVICKGNDTLYNIETEKGYGTLLIGRNTPVSDERLRLWEKEASVYFNVEGQDLDLVLLGWQNIKHLEPRVELSANDELKFILTHSSGMTLINAVHKVTEGSAVDILLKNE